MRNLLYYAVGIAVISFLFIGAVRFFLSFMPYVALAFVITLPFYGIVCKAKKLDKQKYGARRFVKGFKSVFSVKKKSFTFYLLLGIVLGFTFADIVWTLVEALMYMLIGLLVFYVVWETARWSLKKIAKYEMISFKEAVKYAW